MLVSGKSSSPSTEGPTTFSFEYRVGTIFLPPAPEVNLPYTSSSATLRATLSELWGTWNFIQSPGADPLPSSFHTAQVSLDPTPVLIARMSSESVGHCSWS